MTKEEQLRAEVETLREELRRTSNKAQNLEIEIGRVRAELDNVQDRKGAPTILDVLTEEGFDRLRGLFPKGIRKSGTGLRPDETAISVIWCLTRALCEATDAIHDAAEATEEAEDVFNQTVDRNIQMSIDIARMTRALAEFAMRETERPHAPEGDE